MYGSPRRMWSKQELRCRSLQGCAVLLPCFSTNEVLPSGEPARGTRVLGRQCPPRIPWVLRAQHPGALVLQELPLARASSVEMPSVGFHASNQVCFGAPPTKQCFLERLASKALGSSAPGRLSCCAMRCLGAACPSPL